MYCSHRVFLTVCLLAGGCSGSNGNVAADTDTDSTGSGGTDGSVTGSVTGTDTVATSASATDGSGSDTGTDTGGSEEECPDSLGIPVIPFDDTSTTIAFSEVVPDFEVETLRGTFRLSEEWTGCGTVALVPVSSVLNATPVENLLNSADNVTYLFFSMASDPDPFVSEIGSKIEDFLMAQGTDVYDKWTNRFRYVTTSGSDVELFSYATSVNTDYFVIDTRQRLRDAGSFQVYNGSFVPWIEMIQHGPKWFNYERRLEDKLAEDATRDDILIVPWLEVGHSETEEGAFDLQLPSAEEMAKYDRVEIVVKESCGDRFPVHLGVCPEWDVGAQIGLCPSGSCATDEDRHVFWRYITGYHSGGWWAEEVNHALPYFKVGGAVRMHLNRGDFEGQIELRFFDELPDDAEIVRDSIRLYQMGRASWRQTHNELYPNYTFTAPPGTTKVVMTNQMSGHGNDAVTSCAEFCTHEHEMNINGTSFHSPFEQKSTWDCAARAEQGVVAGQFGTWYFDRGSWCPGFPVERWVVDITSAVNLSGTNTILWTGTFEGNDWPTGGNVNSQPWVVFYGSQDGGKGSAAPIDKVSCTTPTIRVRDFASTHPDFAPMTAAFQALPDGNAEKEGARNRLLGVVADQLVNDGGEWKPVFIWPENTLPYSTEANFDQWFRDVPGTNIAVDVQADFHESREGTAIFPYHQQFVDHPLLAWDFGYGDEGATGAPFVGGDPIAVNASLTYELATTITYNGGERLRFGSHEDMWIFVDHELAVDNGGPWRGFTDTVLNLDDLGLATGQTYDLHVFGALGRRNRGPQLWLELPECD